MNASSGSSTQSDNPVPGFFFYILYLCVEFFVKIGDLVRFFILIPVKALGFVARIPDKVSRTISRFLRRAPKPAVPAAVPLPKTHTPISRTYMSKGKTVLRVLRFVRTVGYFLRFIIFFVGKHLVRFCFAFVRLIIFLVRRIGSVVLWIILLPYRLFMSIFTQQFRFFLFGFLFCVGVVVAVQSYKFIVGLPNPQTIGMVNFPQSTHIYDRNGKLLYEVFRDENRTPVSLSELPTYVKQASIAIEDKDFYRHNGVSFVSGIFRAIKDSLATKSLQGGSTITQQLVKSALLTPERTFQRKIKEIVLALWTEKLFTKDQILGMYLNQVPYGGSSYGIEEASKTYFGKPAKDLTVGEAALLAGLPQAPSLYSPYINPALAKARRNDVLRKMYEQGYINKDQETEALEADISVVPLQTSIKAPHFVFYIKSVLENEYGIQQVEEGGLNVYTTLDLDIQEEAEKILQEELDKVKNLNVTNGAVLVTRPGTGEILAMVGSVDYYAAPSGAFNVTTALRQPGSSIKPLTYALALEKGFTAATILDDSPTSFGVPGSRPYQPVNYDGRFHGRVPLRYALANSYNIPAVKALNAVGVDNFVSFAKKMGISTWNDSSRFGLSLTLGGGEVHMTDMATAFGVFANAGNRVDVTGILRIQNMKNDTLYELTEKKVHVLDEGIAYIMSDMLSDNFARRMAFGPNSALEVPGYKISVKTGTTDEKKDNWTIGYTPEFLTAVWVGNNDNTPMNPYLSSGVTGAAPIWNRTMKYLLTKYGSDAWFPKPDDIVEKSCYFGKVEYFVRGTENKVGCRDSLFGISPTPTPAP